jgi:thioredoxin reductase (NADPH)
MTVPFDDPLISRRGQLLPVLDEAQLARIRKIAKRRLVKRGETLVEVGDESPHFFVVISGGIDAVRVRRDAEGRENEELVVTVGPGEFTGEMNMLSGRRSLFRARAAQDGELLELDLDGFRRLVQTDAELSELIMRAFILRRVSIISRGMGNALVLGSRHSAETLRLREFLTRNGQPYEYVDVDRDADVAPLLDRFHVAVQDIPLLICRGELVLRNPTLQAVAECLGLNPEIDQATVHDVIVVGAGPAGLAAAVYGASEGLDVLVLETTGPGGQAGSSSKIENYLGFPTGISGQALAGRAYAQAQKFGAKMLIALQAAKLSCDRTPYTIDLGDAGRALGRTIVIASGAQYRKLPVENMTRFEGVGVYYGATRMEAQLCEGDEVIVVGGGNSAGQAAVFLSETVQHVHLLVRSAGLADSMSRYLIRRIEDSPKITLRAYTEIEGCEGNGALEAVRWRNSKSAEVETRPIRHVFVMTGADPNTDWLRGCVALDDKGFVKTGVDVAASELAHWPRTRHPYMLETSIPGVFAVGDVRSGSVKRVASAVGEGSICIQLVHRVLAEH